MDLITPSVGLIFWTTIVFIILLVLLRSLAWKPILSAIKGREQSIQDALDSAKKAKEEIALINTQKDKALKRSVEERDKMLKEAREMKETIISEAKRNALIEANKLVENAKLSIEKEKLLAINEIKNQVGQLSIEIAEKILNTQLVENDTQKELVNNIIEQAKFN